MQTPISICSQAAEISNEFERNNSELKKSYLIKSILLYNEIVSKINGNCGTFGTGYPFYALGQNLEGELPIIEEQFRYNQELIDATNASKHSIWSCGACLSKNSQNMPDLKQICKPCPNTDDALKPRKVINRLPDMDMWMVCKKENIDNAKEVLIHLFNEKGIQSSDIDPIRTIYEIKEITENLQSGIMPTKNLPIDAHIIDSATLLSLIEQVPYTLENAINNNQVPYLPIHPISYRKTWQYDDAAYNFIHDYLSSLTEFDLDSDLSQLLSETRREIASTYSFEQLYYFLLSTGPESVKRRHKTLQLKNRFKERTESWKK